MQHRFHSKCGCTYILLASCTASVCMVSVCISTTLIMFWSAALVPCSPDNPVRLTQYSSDFIGCLEVCTNGMLYAES